MRTNALSIALTVALIVAPAAVPGCTHPPQRMLVVMDRTLEETISDIFKIDQRALCGKDDCYEPSTTGGGGGTTLIAPIPGWSQEKSRALNKALLPVAQASSQFNAIMAAWNPGAPIPAQLHIIIAGLGSALSQISALFPDGSAKSQMLASIGRVQMVVLQTLDLMMAFTSPVPERPR